MTSIMMLVLTYMMTYQLKHISPDNRFHASCGATLRNNDKRQHQYQSIIMQIQFNSKSQNSLLQSSESFSPAVVQKTQTTKIVTQAKSKLTPVTFLTFISSQRQTYMSKYMLKIAIPYPVSSSRKKLILCHLLQSEGGQIDHNGDEEENLMQKSGQRPQQLQMFGHKK